MTGGIVYDRGAKVHYDRLTAELAARFPLADATAEGLHAIDDVKRGVGAELRPTPWMPPDQNGRYWAAASYAVDYHERMGERERAEYARTRQARHRTFLASAAR